MQCNIVEAAEMLVDPFDGMVVAKELECYHKCLHYLLPGLFVFDALLTIVGAHEFLNCSAYWHRMGRYLSLGNTELKIVASSRKASRHALAAAVKNAEDAEPDHADGLRVLLLHFAEKQGSKKTLSTMLTLMCRVNKDVRKSLVSQLSSHDLDKLLSRCHDCYKKLSKFFRTFSHLTLTKEQLIMLHKATLERQPDVHSLRAAVKLLLDKGLDNEQLKDIASWAARASQDVAGKAVDLLYKLAKRRIFLPSHELQQLATFLPESPKLVKISRLSAKNGDCGKSDSSKLPKASV